MRALLVLWLVACAKVPPAPTAAGGPLASVVTVLAPVDGPATTQAPEAHWTAVLRALATAGLDGRVVNADLADVRASDKRLALMAKASNGAEWVVLIEATPAFSSQIAGRYRWEVSSTVTLARASDLSRSTTWTWKIPVFLRFYHEREAEALDAAAPVLRKRLEAALVDGLP